MSDREGERERDLVLLFWQHLFFFFKPQIHPSLKKEWMEQKRIGPRVVSRITEWNLGEEGRRRETFSFFSSCIEI